MISSERETAKPLRGSRLTVGDHNRTSAVREPSRRAGGKTWRPRAALFVLSQADSDILSDPESARILGSSCNAAALQSRFHEPRPERRRSFAGAGPRLPAKALEVMSHST